MRMFEAVGAFKNQFVPVEGGYLFYPSRKSGGKLVTVEEYNGLMADWERVAGRAGLWKTVGVVVLLLLLWTLLSQALSLPGWMDTLVTAVFVIAISAWSLWSSFAPRRLVKDRPTVAPPRSASVAGREARAALNWSFIIFALLLSGATFFGTIAISEPTLSTWAWLVGSGLMLAAYVWIAFRKLIDGQR